MTKHDNAVAATRIFVHGNLTGHGAVVNRDADGAVTAIICRRCNQTFYERPMVEICGELEDGA